jgi:Kef-type K+ transport system membrane component KefB
MSAVYLVLFLIPALALGWRVIVTKSRNNMLRVAGAGAVMVTVVGALVVYDDLDGFTFKDWRVDIALLAAISSSIYLLIWSLRRRTNQRYRTISIIAAIIGFLPFVSAIATTFLFGQQP